MNAVCIYASAAQLVLQVDAVDAACQQRLIDLSRLLPRLRQLLSCVVCCRLLNDPYSPRAGRCQHNVCRLCVRGRKALRPLCLTCKDCQDFKTYDENRQMHCLLLCYKSLCEHVMGSTLFSQLSKQKPTSTLANSGPSIPMPHMSTQEFVLEGASYDNILGSFNVDLPRASLIPKLQFSATALTTSSTHTPLSSSAATPLVSSIALHNLTAPKAATPPVSIALPLSTPPPPPPPPPLLTQESISPTLPFPAATNSSFHATTQPPTLAPSLAIKKSVIELPASMHQATAVSSTATCHFMSTSTITSAPPSITYVAPHTPGVVVPIVSSSGTTTAPLSIATAKVQSMNRQLVQARNAALNASSADRHPPLTFKVSMTPGVAVSSSLVSTMSGATNTSTNTTTSTVTSQQIRNPPPIKTVSNGSAMYSVLYTGIGNKITIKRKTDGDEDTAQRKNAATSTPPPTVFRQMAKSSNLKRRGCRCGNATPTPGKLTCCGQRCPCYVDSKSCIGCKCRGCRNPHRPDGGKVRPVIPELACYEIQMADESSSLSPSELPIATTVTAEPLPPAAAVSMSVASSEPTLHQQQLQQFQDFATTVTAMTQQQPTSMPEISMTPATSSATLIPLRNLQQFAVASQQQTQTHGQMLSNGSSINGNGLQLESLQRESVLIQNVEGKYQVVNVFTSSAAQVHTNVTNNMRSLQRSHALSQLQSLQSATCSNGSNTFLLPSVTSCIPASSIACTSMPQIIVQQQHQQPQTTHLHSRLAMATSTTTTVGGSSNSHSHLPLQVQQQLKQSNIITVHPISNSHNASTAQSNMPLMATSSTPNTTITLSPIIVTSPNTFSTDMFSDSSEEFISLKSAATTSNSCSSASPSSMSATGSASHILTVPMAQASPQTLRAAATTSATPGISAAAATHMTPIEVIDSNDLHLLQADGFANY